MPTNFLNIVPSYTRVSSPFTFPLIRTATGTQHKGVDLVAEVGSAIYSPPMDGVVVQNKYDGRAGGYGNYVVVMTKLPGNRGEIFTVYAHLQSLLIDPATGSPCVLNTPVSAGTQIGSVGNSGFDGSGNPYPVHLHYEELLGSTSLLNADGTLKNPGDWKNATLPIDPSWNYFGYTGTVPNVCYADGTGMSIPNQPTDPGQHYVEISSPSQVGRLYDNGVLYTKDTQTGMEHWSVPTANGSVVDTTQYPNGQVASVQYNQDVTTGAWVLDTSPANIQQYLQQQIQELSASGYTPQDQQIWQNGLQEFNSAITNDPNAVITTSPDGVSVTTDNGNFTLLGNTLTQTIQSGSITTQYNYGTGTLTQTVESTINGQATIAGQSLSITAVSNFTHGSGYLDANGYIHFTPDANYFGAAMNNADWRIAA